MGTLDGIMNPASKSIFCLCFLLQSLSISKVIKTMRRVSLNSLLLVKYLPGSVVAYFLADGELFSYCYM